jgi:hypothetical protein
MNGQSLPELVNTALTAVQTEYPHQLAQVLYADTDLRPPRDLNPSFYGSADWHSAVHNHWLLVRALGRGLPDDLAALVISLLDKHLAPDRLAAEEAFFASPGGRTSERPYGWAWLLLLHAECQAGGHRWAQPLAPLAELLSERLNAYFSGGLAFPIRSGVHANTAFSLGLCLEAARRRGDQDAVDTLTAAARRFFAGDTTLPWAEPPSGDAFLTPALAEAALMASALPPGEFTGWLDRVLPDTSTADLAPPHFVPDGADPATVHLEGLLISRAWCLRDILSALPPAHPAVPGFAAALEAHQAQVARIEPADGFNRSHWLPTFLLYLDDHRCDYDISGMPD